MKLNYTYIIVLLSLLVVTAGCTSHQAANSNKGSNAPSAGEAVNNNTVQAPAEIPKQNNTVAAAEIPSVSTGIVSSAQLKYVQSANMYEGNLNFILENGQRYTLNQVCVAANNFDLGQCYKINISNVSSVRAQVEKSSGLSGCYIPDFTPKTLEKVSCPPALS